MVEEFGKPLVIKSVPVPEPGHGQVLVKVIASGVPWHALAAKILGQDLTQRDSLVIRPRGSF